MFDVFEFPKHTLCFIGRKRAIKIYQVYVLVALKNYSHNIVLVPSSPLGLLMTLGKVFPKVVVSANDTGGTQRLQSVGFVNCVSCI